jgi:hypothetical protein
MLVTIYQATWRHIPEDSILKSLNCIRQNRVWSKNFHVLIVSCLILWHVDPLLGNGREMSKHVTAVARLRPVKSNGGKVFSVLSVSRLQGGQVRSWLVS